MARRKTLPPRHGKHKGARSRPHEAAQWLYGIHTALAALSNPERRCSRILICEPALEGRIANSGGTRPLPHIECVSRGEMDMILPEGAVHQGIAVFASPLPQVSLDTICRQVAGRPSVRLVALDQVTDPQNIGAIIRTSAAFGASAIIVQDRHTPPITGALAKAASGGLEHCPLVRVTNLARALDSMRRAGLWCVGLDGAAPNSLQAATVAGPMVVVLGAEGSGLRRLTREHCDMLARIPYSGPVASLNVSNAAAIALYEFSRSGDQADG